MLVAKKPIMAGNPIWEEIPNQLTKVKSTLPLPD